MRKKIVAANWKMNMTLGESARFIESFLLDAADIRDVEIVIVPPFTAIAKVTELLENKAQSIKVGAQNMHWEPNGPFTGEISAALLRDLLVRYVVLGHCERRMLFKETDEIVNRKVRAAHEATLRPIVCVGETLEQRDKGNVEKILSIQLRGSLKDLNEKELHAGMIEDEVNLKRVQTGVDRDQDTAGPRHRLQKLEVAIRVERQDPDPSAIRDAEGPERAGQPAHPVELLGVSADALTEDAGGQVRRLLRGAVQGLGQVHGGASTTR